MPARRCMALRPRASALVGLSWNSDATRQIWSEASDGTVSVSRPVAREERAGCTCLLGGSLPLVVAAGGIGCYRLNIATVSELPILGLPGSRVWCQLESQLENY